LSVRLRRKIFAGPAWAVRNKNLLTAGGEGG
jgi:hypothetical protein